jgi:hypothetical protein
VATTAKVYSKANGYFVGGSIAFQTDTIKCALCKPTYTPTQNTDEFWSTPQAQEHTYGGNYSAGGATLGSKTKATATTVTTLDAADTAWTGLSGTARYAVIYKDTGNAATSPLIAYVDFGADQVLSAVDFTIVWAAGGIATFTVS